MENRIFLNSVYNEKRNLKVPSNIATRYTKSFWRKIKNISGRHFKNPTQMAIFMVGNIHEIVYYKVAIHSKIDYKFNANLIEMPTALFFK